MRKKYIIGLAAAAAVALFTFSANAQQKKHKKTEVGEVIEKTGEAVEKGASAVGNKTAEVAVKGASKVTDKTFKGRMAPDGSNVYIDSKNRKYYVTKKGAKIYLKSTQIRVRPKVD